MANQRPPYPDDLRGKAEPVSDNIRQIVARVGWAVVAVVDRRPFSYTVGVTRLIGHPELIVTGLPDEVAKRFLNGAVAHLREGGRLDPGLTVDGLFEDFEVAVRPVVRSQLPQLAFAADFYGGLTFTAYQLVWPDRDHRLPWDRGAAQAYVQAQPLLSTPRRSWRRLIGR